MIDMSNKDTVGYEAFYKEYSIFLKEGIVTSQSPIEKVSAIKKKKLKIYKCSSTVKYLIILFFSGRNSQTAPL